MPDQESLNALSNASGNASHTDLLRQYRAFISSEAILSDSSDFEIFRLEESAQSPEIFQIRENLVFGKRMEKFFSLYIQASQRYRLLSENLQIIDNKTTIGELDFILHDHQKDEVLHVELACKFYLYVPSSTKAYSAFNWFGPNRKDRLDKKLSKLREHQFPLLQRNETKQMLHQLGINQRQVHQQLCLQGMLFLPYQDEISIPASLNPASICGQWLHAYQFSEDQFLEAQFYFPGKEEWLLSMDLASTWLDFKTAREFLNEKVGMEKSVMCWVRYNSDSYQRFFVVWW